MCSLSGNHVWTLHVYRVGQQDLEQDLDPVCVHCCMITSAQHICPVLHDYLCATYLPSVG